MDVALSWGVCSPGEKGQGVGWLFLCESQQFPYSCSYVSPFKLLQEAMCSLALTPPLPPPFLLILSTSSSYFTMEGAESYWFSRIVLFTSISKGTSKVSSKSLCLWSGTYFELQLYEYHARPTHPCPPYTYSLLKEVRWISIKHWWRKQSIEGLVQHEWPR